MQEKNSTLSWVFSHDIRNEHSLRGEKRCWIAVAPTQFLVLKFSTKSAHTIQQSQQQRIPNDILINGGHHFNINEAIAAQRANRWPKSCAESWSKRKEQPELCPSKRIQIRLSIKLMNGAESGGTATYFVCIWISCCSCWRPLKQPIIRLCNWKNVCTAMGRNQRGSATPP